MFTSIVAENVVQVSDKTRIDCTRCFVAKGEAALTSVKIKPSATDSFITVTGTSSKDWFLDWQYATAGTKVVTIEIDNGTTPVTLTKDILVVSVADDRLFSNDSDLIAKEPDVLKWTSPGRSSFLNVHRQAQAEILDWLDQIRVWKDNGTRLTKTDLPLSTDLKELSINWTLGIIFAQLSNAIDDIFDRKSKNYMAKVEVLKSKGSIQADFDGDSTIESTERTDLRSLSMVRR